MEHKYLQVAGNTALLMGGHGIYWRICLWHIDLPTLIKNDANVIGMAMAIFEIGLLLFSNFGY